MKINEIFSEIENDFNEITEINIKESYQALSTLFRKYITMKANENMILQSLHVKKKRLVVKKQEYYSGNASAEEYKLNPFPLKLKTDKAIQKYIDSDNELLVMDEQIIIQQEKVDVLTSVLWELKNRERIINGLREQVKFETGY